MVAGIISISAMNKPNLAAKTIFTDAYKPTEVIRLVGCFWLAIAILSALGLYRPIVFSPVLLIQLIYKGVWLFLVAFPAIKKDTKYPKAMALFFLVWVLVLPFVIPWKIWFEA